MNSNTIAIEEPAKGIATVTSTFASIYDMPNGQQVLQVPQGLNLPFFKRYSETLDNGSTNDWYEVTLLDGSKGWLLANNSASIRMAPATAPSTLNDAIITIDPGHGGSATGAVSADGTVIEKEANLAIALKLRDALKTAGVQDTNIWMTRQTDIDVSLAYRADLGTASGGNMFVSIHNNGSTLSSASGTETYYQCGKEQTTTTKEKSKKLAELVQQGLLNSISMASSICGAQPNNRGVKCRLGSKRQDYYYVLRNTFLPAILSECVFVSNAVEGKCLLKPEFQQLLADGICNGIIAYFS